MNRMAKIGAFAVLVLLLLAFFILRIERLNLFGEGGPTVDAVFESVDGLNDRSIVRIAGVRVGQVDGITLDGRAARVRLRLEQPVVLTEGTFARIASLGLLGENYVELVLGPEGAPQLADGATVRGETPLGIDDALAKLGDVADSISGLSADLSGGITGAQGDTPIGRLISNLEASSAQLRLLLESNQEQLSGTIRNFESFSGQLADNLPRLMNNLDTLVAEVRGVLGDNREQIDASAANIASLTERLDETAADLGVITERLASGEGSLGKLLTSDEAHDQLVDTLASVEDGVGQLSNTLGRVERLSLDLDLGGFYLSDREESHGTFGITLRPDKESKRLYRLALVTTPGGETNSRTQRITTTAPDGTTSTEFIETFTTEDESVISALFGYRFDNDAQVWAGLIEDHFGVQATVPLFRDRFWLGLEAFDFDRDQEREPHLRLTGRYWLNDNLFLQAGYDDPLESEFDSIFIGGGLRWNDDSLKYLLGSVPLRP